MIMNALEFLKNNEVKTGDSFIKEAQFIKENWDWLKYSYAVAIKVRRRMEELGLTQKQLAQLMGCTQQHVSVILAGRANLTLETISKFEKALNINLVGNLLIDFPEEIQPAHYGYLNERKPTDPPLDVDTSKFVSGYIKKKKGPKSK